MPPFTNASYVGRFAPPGRPKTTSTPSAFKHSINASTARISSPPFPSLSWPKKPVYQRVYSRLGGADADADGEHDRAADGYDEQRGAQRHFEEAVAHPGDREQLEGDHA